MSKHIELATPCPNCQSRLTLSVRRTPLMGFHAVRLACENGCDLHWYYYDLPNGRAWFPTVEQCAYYHDGVIRREGEENERIRAFECPNCGECPHVSSKSIGRQTFPTVTCRCASYWDRDLHSALRMADRDQKQEERGHPRKNRPFHDVSDGTRLPVLRRAGVRPHHRDRQ